VLNALLRTDDAALLPPPLRVYYQDVYDHALRLVEQVDLHRDLLSGAMDALMAQTSNRLNQVMKTMTALSTILMSVSLVAGVYGMNFRNMPELDWIFGYPMAIGLMIAMGGGLYLVFKKNGWL
jgi:magnesium transporter